LPSHISDTFLEASTNRYLYLFNYIIYDDDTEAENLESHRNIALLYLDHIDNEPIAAFTGVGEGDHLNVDSSEEKKGTGAHNAYILILSENGPLALFFFLYMTWLILKTSFFINQHSPRNFAKSLFYFNSVYLLSFILYGSQFLATIFWIIIGITFAEKTRLQLEHADLPYRHQSIKYDGTLQEYSIH
jgi:hypothetical protein